MKIKHRIRSWLLGHGERYAKEDLGVELSEIRDVDHFRQLYRASRRTKLRREVVGFLIGFLLGAGLLIVGFVLYSG